MFNEEYYEQKNIKRNKECYTLFVILFTLVIVSIVFYFLGI